MSVHETLVEGYYLRLFSKTLETCMVMAKGHCFLLVVDIVLYGVY